MILRGWCTMGSQFTRCAMSAVIATFCVHQVSVERTVLAADLAEVLQILESDSTLWKLASEQKLEEKQRRKLGLQAFGSYLEDLLVRSKDNSKGLSPNEFKTTFAKLSKGFDSAVPSFQVQSLPKSFQLRVRLNVDQTKLQALLKKEGVEASSILLSNSNNSSAAKPAPPVSSNLINEESDSKDLIPYTSFLIDEKNRSIYVTPAKALGRFAVERTGALPNGFQLKPAAARATKPSQDPFVNSTDTPLDERATLFSQRVLVALQNPKLVTRPSWTSDILKFVFTSTEMDSSDPQENGKRIWPLRLPWTFSTLYNNPGIVSVFVVRSDDRAGVLEKAEIVGFSGAHFTRQYWSRAQNDPTYQDQPSKVLDRISAAFVRAAKQKKPFSRPENLEIFVDKSVSERDIVLIEAQIRPFALGHEHLLIPKSVDGQGVRYTTPLPRDQSARIRERMAKALEKNNVELRQTEDGNISLTLKNSSENAASKEPKAKK